jgi:CCR4-NOT transcription complex subunit 7/8
MGEFKRKSDYHYQTLRCNVDILKMIQLGITLFDEEGNTPPGEFSTWQFNFKFSLESVSSIVPVPLGL